MKGTLEMSKKERERLGVLRLVKGAGLRLTKAAAMLAMSYRQCTRIYKRYREEGDGGLVHRSRGRASNRRKEVAFRERVIERYRER